MGCSGSSRAASVDLTDPFACGALVHTDTQKAVEAKDGVLGKKTYELAHETQKPLSGKMTSQDAEEAARAAKLFDQLGADKALLAHTFPDTIIGVWGDNDRRNYKAEQERKQKAAAKEKPENAKSENATAKPTKEPTKDQIADMMVAACGNEVDEVKKLLKVVPVNSTDYMGKTALIKACVGEAVDVIKLLLENKADVSLSGMDQATPLHTAVRTGSVGCAKLLVAAGADHQAKDLEDKTPLGRAEENSNGTDEEKMKVVIEYLKAL